MATSTQRQTADAVVAAFNNMDIDGLMSHRSPECMRYFAPTSVGLKPMDNTTYANSLDKLRAIFHNFSLTVDDVVEDKPAHRITMWCKARADTAAGEYVNEYVWLLNFDASGEKITSSKEFSDSAMARDFFPKLTAAMEEMQKKQ